jgi:hypothetical protein
MANIGSPAIGKAQLDIRRGDDITMSWELKDPDTLNPIDLTGYTFAMKVRRAYDRSVILTFAIDMTDPVNGLFTSSVTATDTAALTECNFINEGQEKGRIGVWDLEQTDPTGKVQTIAGGEAWLWKDVTYND